LDWLEMFDSNDRNFGKIHRDAFAVLKKTKSPRKTAKSTKSHWWRRLRLGR
jgi:hypothetical protein